MRTYQASLFLGCFLAFCKGTPLLLFANRKDIRLVDGGGNNKSNNATVVIDRLDDAAALDFHHAEQAVYWTDVSLYTIKRTWVNRTGFSEDLVVTGLASPDGLAVDWLARKLYWTDSETNRIEVSNLDGSHRKVLFWQDLDQPRAIALDPLNGYMYWTDWGEMPKIERAGMDGTPRSRQVIVMDNIYWPNGLTLDYDISKIYWADAKLNFIHSCNFDGSDRRVIVEGQDTLPHPFALSLFDNTLFWTDWQTRAIHSCDKLTGTNLKQVHGDIFSPMDIHVYHERRQPKGVNPCGRKNGGCSHLCLMSPRPPFFSCACPTGVKLKDDGVTCADGAQEILLLARRTDIRRISLDTPDYTDVVLQLDSIRHAIAIDYDPVDGHIYWTDDEVRAIRRAYMDGSGEETIVSTEVDNPDGIAIDWIARNVYWTDTGTDRIEVARLNGTSRKVLVSEKLDEPRAIVLDPMGGYMYWTDWGDNPKIERANLDGTERIVLVNSSLGWPNGLALDFATNKIYWGDAKTDSIEVANMDGTGRKTLLSEQIPHIFGFSLLGDYIYWTDWQRRSIERINKHRGDDRTVIIEQLPDLMGLKAVRRAHDPAAVDVDANGCSVQNGGCSHLCLNRPHPQEYVCACPMGLELTQDGKICIVPEAFLLFTRRDDIRRISLETNNNDVIIPVSGVKEATALDFDINDSRIYWTDVVAKTINRAFMNGSMLERVVEHGLNYPEGICVDWVAHNIYWADTGTRRIEMARLDGSARKVIIWTQIEDPRSIALDPPNGHMYFADWGKNPTIERAALDGSHRVVIMENVGRANGLTIDFADDRLFWTDLDANVIESADLMGNNRRTIISEDLPRPYGLTQYEDFIYWTDWKTNSIERCNKTNGLNRTRIQDKLEYVMDLLVFHASRQSGYNPCGVNNGECSHLCIAHSDEYVTNYTHHCACPTHFELGKDNKTCYAPDAHLLFAQKSSISRMMLNADESPEIVLPIQGLRNIKALAQDPIEGHIYWIDGRTKTIRRAFSNGTDASVVIPNPSSQDLFQPYDLALDPFSRHLYWTDQTHNVINVTRLDMQPVGVVMRGPHMKPRSIALAPEKGLMFWTNVVKPPRIERAAMDGTEKTTLFSTSIGEPGALAVDVHAEKIYWSDLELKRIEYGDFDGGNRKVLVDSHIMTPNSLAVFDNYLYWLDKEQSLIERVNKRNGRDRRRVQSRVPQLNDLAAVNMITEERMYDNKCSVKNGDCSHLCVMEPDRTRRCSCPVHLKLMKDDRSCAEPPTCAPDQFTCKSGSINCIPLVWQCDGYSECEDESDEEECPTCSPTQFRCTDGGCIPQREQCDKNYQCKDRSDEDNCAPCAPSQFECAKDRTCIDERFKCDNTPHCSDQSDEMNCPGVPNTQMHKHKESATAQYTVIIVVGLIAMVFIIIFVVFACKKKPGPHMSLDHDGRDIIMVTKPLNPSGSSSKTTPPYTSSSSRGNKTGTTTCLTMTSMPPGGGSSSMLLYDRNHVTGASSSSSTVTRYPKETLNPPPSPVTDRSQCGGMAAQDLYYSSNSPASSTVQSYRPYRGPSSRRHHHHHHHHHHIPPPPTTPCSTDVCEDSEPYPSKRYYTSFAELDSYCESDPFYPPPPTPRSHYLSDEMSCPPSPSTERSFFNPYPPPPSPVGTSDC